MSYEASSSFARFENLFARYIELGQLKLNNGTYGQ